MKLLLLTLSLILLISLPLFGQTSERPKTIVVPVSVIGEVPDSRKQILQKTLEDELKTHFRLIPQDQFDRVQDKVFEELDYEECTEDQCIVMIQEMLQVENLFHLQVISDEGDTQLSLKWVNLDEKRVEEDYCEGCKTRELRKRVGGLVDELVGLEKDWKSEDDLKKQKNIDLKKRIETKKEKRKLETYFDFIKVVNLRLGVGKYGNQEGIGMFGDLVNESEETLSIVTLQVSFLDNSGKIIKFHEFSPVNRFSWMDPKPLKPGESKEFGLLLEEIIPENWSGNFETKVSKIVFKQ